MRSLQQLRTDQDRLRDHWRRSSPTAPQELRRLSGGPRPTSLRFGRVSSVVASDPTYGPHLMVACRHAGGTPPQWQESPEPSLRCYVAPGCQIVDYSPEAIVRLLFLEGIVVAEPVT